MTTARALFVLPVTTLTAVNEIAGLRGRSAYVTHVLEADIRRRRLREFLASDKVIFRDEDHPELARLGSVAYVKRMRREADRSYQRKRRP